MERFYDLHIHSCLSPCADNDMTPVNIAGMGMLNGLSVMALTDHNSCGNCPAFFEACRSYGITPVAGMELTTAEDIHVVCLFRELEGALGFSETVHSRLMPIKNKPEIFGDQIFTDGVGNETGREDTLLISATDIFLEEAPVLVGEYGGICYPAHIDRDANGIIAILGDIPPEPGFICAEIHDSELLERYRCDYPITQGMRFVSSSDAHHLWDINMNVNSFTLHGETEAEIRASLFDMLTIGAT